MCRPGQTDASDNDPNVAAQKKNDESGAVPSGFQRRRKLVELGLVGLSAIYGFVYYLNPNIVVSSRYCNAGEEQCLRSDLLAFKAASLAAMAIMGLMGFYHWHLNPQLAQLSKGTPEDRLFAYLPAADYQNVASFCYQLWDLIISLAIPEHADPIFLVHHFLAATTAYCSLEYQIFPYYSIFYGGCSEFSSIFLVFLDKHEFFVVEKGSLMDQWMLVCKGMFFLTFSFYRIFGWIYYSFPLWKDCLTVLNSGALEQHRPGKAHFMKMFLGLDVLLGALQLYWYFDILKAAMAIVQ